MSAVNAGYVTAYGAAVEGGYTGTYEQFCEQQANYASTAAHVDDVAEYCDTVAEHCDDVLESIPYDYSALSDDVGDLSELETTDKTNLVSAINEIKEGGIAWDEIEEGESFFYKPPLAPVSLTLSVTTPGTVFYDSMSLATVKSLLTATVLYNDDTTETVTDYTLTGTIAVGDCLLTGSYQGLYDTLTITVVEQTATATGISASCTQSAINIYDSLDSLRDYLTVLILYDDSTSIETFEYTLSGTLAVGTNTITVTYQNFTTTFTITGVSDGSYVTNGLVAYWDISQYADNYTGEFEDEIGGVELIQYGLSLSEIAQYCSWAGVHGGILFMAAKYDGGTKEYRYRIPNAAGLGSYPFTYELYGIMHSEIYKYSQTEAYNALIDNFAMFNGRINDSGSTVNGINIVSAVNENGFAFKFVGSGNTPNLTSTYFPNGIPMRDNTDATVTTMTHLVVCADRTNHVNKIYFNGNLILDGEQSCVTLTGTNALYPECMHIAKVRTYNRILTDAEVRRNYANCTGV